MVTLKSKLVLLTSLLFKIKREHTNIVTVNKIIHNMYYATLVFVEI